MIIIRFQTEGGTLSLTMDGHATGSAAVCAGASALVCTLAGWLERHGAERVQQLTPGKARIVCRDTEDARRGFAVIATGMQMLAEAHPDKVEILGKTTGVFPTEIW